jgi:hypothetical protein
MPNREADRYVTKNIILTDDRYLQFYTVKKTNVVNGGYLKMLMDGDDPVFAYLDTKGGSGMSVNADGTGGAGSNNTDAWAQRAKFKWNGAASAIAPDYVEYLAKAISATDQMGMAQDESGRYTHMTVYNHDTGGIDFIYDRFSELWGSGGHGFMAGMPYVYWKGEKTSYRGNTAISLERNRQVAMSIDRFWYPKLVARGNSMTGLGAANYLLYFDEGSATKDLIFRIFQIGQGVSGGRNKPMSPWGIDPNTGAPYNLTTEAPTNADATGTVGRTKGMSGLYGDGFPLFHSVMETWQKDSQSRPYLNTYTNADEGVGEYYAPSAVFTAGRNVPAAGASRYFDMAVTTDQRVILVYFDEAAAKLRLKYSTNNHIDGSTTAGITFSENTTVVLPDYVGMYVSMTLDANDGIHIAALDSIDSDLKYIYLPAYNAPNCATITVDQFGSVGNWTDIKIQPGTKRPYIAYYNATEAGGRESIKLAYSKAEVAAISDVLKGVDDNGYTLGNWEYMTVPALDPPQGGAPKFQKVNLGFQSGQGNRPLLGYLGTNIEFSYAVPE